MSMTSSYWKYWDGGFCTVVPKPMLTLRRKSGRAEEEEQQISLSVWTEVDGHDGCTKQCFTWLQCQYFPILRCVVVVFEILTKSCGIGMANFHGHGHVFILLLLIGHALSAAVPTCNHTLLLAFGRTATKTVGDALTKGTSLSYCDGTKEYFKKSTQHHISLSALKNCASANPDGWLLHVKPEHLKEVNPRLFFQMAKQAGFRQILTTYRDNVLARDVSSYELGRADDHGGYEANQISWDNWFHYLRQRTTQYNRAYVAAKQNDFDIHFYAFDELLRDSCSSLKQMVQKMGCAGPSFNCGNIVSKHTETSHRNVSLENRLPARDTRSLRKQLSGTNAEWMLDLSAVVWPANVPRPIPLTPIPERNFHL